jgi:dTDP-4-amino-4,6-dideoxygalactose transaminase
MQVPYLDLKAQYLSIRSEIDAAIQKTIENCTFCLGPDVLNFEKQFSDYCDIQHTVALNSGTSALHLAMLLLDVKAGDEVITTPFTFVATSWAISYVGAKPVYVDIDAKTYNLDPSLIQSAITSKTKAILPVHLYGMPFEINEIMPIAKKHNLPLIEDAAQAHGAEYHGKRVGGFGDISCFSFYPGKNLGAFGEGGALVTNNETFAVRAKALREHGSTKRYYHDEIGYNYRMEGIQGAVLGVKLKKLDEWTKARRRVAKMYNELLRDTPLVLPYEHEHVKSAYHLYVVRHSKRDELKDYLQKHEVGWGIHYPLPLHLQKCYSHLGYKKGSFPVAEKVAEECLSLPIYPELSDDQIEYVSEVIHNFFK